MARGARPRRGAEPRGIVRFAPGARGGDSRAGPDPRWARIVGNRPRRGGGADRARRLQDRPRDRARRDGGRVPRRADLARAGRRPQGPPRGRRPRQTHHYALSPRGQRPRGASATPGSWRSWRSARTPECTSSRWSSSRVSLDTILQRIRSSPPRRCAARRRASSFLGSPRRATPRKPNRGNPNIPGRIAARSPPIALISRRPASSSRRSPIRSTLPTSRGRPPRREAGQHPDPPRRLASPHRFRPRPPRGDANDHALGAVPRNAALCLPRAGGGAPQGDRPANRHLFFGCDALRAPHAANAARRDVRAGDPLADRHRGSLRSPTMESHDSTRPRHGRDEVAREGSGAPLCHGRRLCRRPPRILGVPPDRGARPATRLERISKFARRHRAATGAGSLGFAAAAAAAALLVSPAGHAPRFVARPPEPTSTSTGGSRARSRAARRSRRASSLGSTGSASRNPTKTSRARRRRCSSGAGRRNPSIGRSPARRAPPPRVEPAGAEVALERENPSETPASSSASRPSAGTARTP